MKRSALVALGAIALAGCVGNESRQEEPTNEVAQEVDSLATPSQFNSTRFLEQSSFGPTEANVSHVMTVGINGGSGAISEQFGATRTLYDFSATAPDLGAQFYFNAMSKPDQLRQRTAFALSQIMVVSQNRFKNGSTDDGRVPMGGYLNVLSGDAFATFTTLLHDLTVNIAMGRYLDMVNNKAFAANGTPLSPNENYARELLQLFTFGLDLLNDDGTPVLDANSKKIPAYTQDQVENLSHVLTGWTFGGLPCPTRGHSNPSNYTVPMIPCDVNHDPASYALFNGFSTTAGLGAAAHLDEAINNIVAHQNVPPFICKQLIQHLVTSNPSGAYVARVVAKFKDDGTGAHVRGNMAAVVRGILQDVEARGAAAPVDTATSVYGHLRSPALLMTNLLRWTGATVTLSNPVVVPPPAVDDGAVQLNTWGTLMHQYVPRPPSVFSYYAPSTPLPGAPGFVGPEFGITDTATSFARSNFLSAALLKGIPGITLNLSTIPSDSNLMADWLSTTLMHGQMSAELRTVVLAAVNDAAFTNGTITDPNVKKAMGLYVVVVSREYQVQR